MFECLQVPSGANARRICFLETLSLDRKLHSPLFEAVTEVWSAHTHTHAHTLPLLNDALCNATPPSPHPLLTQTTPHHATTQHKCTHRALPAPSPSPRPSQPHVSTPALKLFFSLKSKMFSVNVEIIFPTAGELQDSLHNLIPNAPA